MTDSVGYWLIDSFADAPYSGNPAGVVLEADGLSDVQMLLIAREINASETAFLSRTHDLHQPLTPTPPRYGLRWFTPTCEVTFCGHATLATGQAMLEAEMLPGGQTEGPLGGPASGRSPDDGDAATLHFDSAAGPLALRPERLPGADPGPVWWLSMPEPKLTPDNTNPMRTCELLGMRLSDLEPGIPIMRTRDDDLILMLREWNTLVSLRPRFSELGEWGQRHKIRGFCVATTHTLSRATSVHSRFFAPTFGIPEDPVTGSVHGPLATLLVIHELIPLAAGKAALNCIQGVAGGRTGLVRAIVEQTGGGYRVSIGGRCYRTLRGELRVPANVPAK